MNLLSIVEVFAFDCGITFVCVGKNELAAICNAIGIVFVWRELPSIVEVFALDCN